MASIASDPNGRRRIQFFDKNGDRKTIRLGKMSQRQAEAFKLKLEDLVAASITGHVPSDETSRWLNDLDVTLYDKLAKAGLVKPRETALLGEFTQTYLNGRIDLKAQTQVNLKRTRTYLVEHFGERRAMRDISPADAEDFRLALIERGLSENTIRRAIGRARQYFKAAKRRGLVHVNPFDDMTANVRSNPDRFYFITREEAGKLLAACPCDQWRLMIALARFGGLRCPSEVLSLTWADINWEHNRIRVPSPKTEHHQGKESRVIPMFPELKPLLMAVFDQAEPGTKHVITRYQGGAVNLRTQLMRIIRRAGLEPWPKLWQNMRSTRETELAETFPMHVVCKWIGNSQPVAMAHYLQLTDEHFERAISEPEKAAQNAAHNLHERSELSGNENDGNDSKTAENVGVLLAIHHDSESFKSQKVPPAGLEPATC